MITVITFGTYDLFHIGHLKIINRAKNLGDKLIVGISTDELNFNKKKKYPVFSQEERLEIIKNLKDVDEVFFEESLEKKREYILKYKANILVMGDDWTGKFDEYNNICKIIYLPRTKDISTTELIDKISKNNLEKYI
jgi:glycerol-3-phosphate cytidylyltransferase